MNELGIEIELDERVAEVGDRFTGRIVRQPDADGVNTDSSARKVTLLLRYETSGRGTTDAKTVATQEFRCASDGSAQGNISLAVPLPGPISYDGKLIRVKWQIQARVDLKLARDPKVHTSVLVVPTNGFAIYTQPHPIRDQF